MPGEGPLSQPTRAQIFAFLVERRNFLQIYGVIFKLALAMHRAI